jgi:chromosome segregation ATPase
VQNALKIAMGMPKKRKVNTENLTPQQRANKMAMLNRIAAELRGQIGNLERRQPTLNNDAMRVQVQKRNQALKRHYLKMKQQSENSFKKLNKASRALRAHTNGLKAKENSLAQKKAKHVEDIQKLQEKIRKLNENLAQLGTNGQNKQTELAKSMLKAHAAHKNHTAAFEQANQEYGNFKRTAHVKYPELAQNM